MTRYFAITQGNYPSGGPTTVCVVQLGTYTFQQPCSLISARVGGYINVAAAAGTFPMFSYELRFVPIAFNFYNPNSNLFTPAGLGVNSETTSVRMPGTSYNFNTHLFDKGALQIAGNGQIQMQCVVHYNFALNDSISLEMQIGVDIPEAPVKPIPTKLKSAGKLFLRS